MFNLILMFNFVIAILGSTYGKYEEIKVGLFYNVLNIMCSTMEWHDYYGLIFALRPPMPTYILLIPFLPFYTCLTGKALKAFNYMMFVILYIPHVLFSILLFFVINALLIPLAYLINSAKMFSRLFTQSSFAKFGQTLVRFIVFMLFGPLVLVTSFFTNIFDFVQSIFVSEHQDIMPSVYKMHVINSELLEMLKELGLEVGCEEGNEFDAPIYVKRIQQHMDLIQTIVEMVFVGKKIKTSDGNKSYDRQ